MLLRMLCCFGLRSLRRIRGMCECCGFLDLGRDAVFLFPGFMGASVLFYYCKIVDELFTVVNRVVVSIYWCK